jgi:hypothetical protein
MDDFGNELEPAMYEALRSHFRFLIDGLRWDGYIVDQFFPNP